MNIFSKAAQYQQLSPAARAFLKLIEGFLLAGVVSIAPLVAQALATPSVDWTVVLKTAIPAFSVAVLSAILKYAKAHGDPSLPTPTTKQPTPASTPSPVATPELASNI